MLTAMINLLRKRLYLKLCIFNSKFYQQTNGVETRKLVSSTAKEIFVQAQEQIAIYTLQRFGNDLLMNFIPSSNVRFWKAFSFTSTIFIETLRLL